VTGERRLCHFCDERCAKHVLDLQGVRLSVCGSCLTEARRDGIDLDAFHPAPEGEEAERR